MARLWPGARHDSVAPDFLELRCLTGAEHLDPPSHHKSETRLATDRVQQWIRTVVVCYKPMKMHFPSMRGIWAGAIALALTATATMFGQGLTTSGLSGFVTDKAGHAVSGALVTVVHDASGTRYTATTRSTGQYTVVGLLSGGPYTITATAAGQPPAEKKGLYLEIGAVGSVDLEMSNEIVQLEAFKVSESAGQMIFDSGSMGTGSNFTPKEIAEISSIRRDLQDIQNLDPRAVVIQVTPSDPAYTYSVAGQNPRNNSLLVDGVSAADNFGLNSNGYAGLRNPIPLDWISSFSIQINPFDVVYSGFLGGITDVTLKTGTNDFHGSAYEMYTGTRMRGPDPVVGVLGPHEATQQHTTGATLGGPIIKDKLFFFVGYEAFRQIAAAPAAALQPRGIPRGAGGGHPDRPDADIALQLQPRPASCHHPHVGAELRGQAQLEHLRLPEVHVHVPAHDRRRPGILQLRLLQRDLVRDVLVQLEPQRPVVHGAAEQRLEPLHPEPPHGGRGHVQALQRHGDAQRPEAAGDHDPEHIGLQPATQLDRHERRALRRHLLGLPGQQHLHLGAGGAPLRRLLRRTTTPSSSAPSSTARATRTPSSRTPSAATRTRTWRTSWRTRPTSRSSRPRRRASRWPPTSRTTTCSISPPSSRTRGSRTPS